MPSERHTVPPLLAHWEGMFSQGVELTQTAHVPARAFREGGRTWRYDCALTRFSS